MSVYKGTTKIWDNPEADEPVILSPKQSLCFFIKYIYELQQMLFDTKSNKSNILDILKSPNTDPSLNQLYKELEIESSFRSQSNVNVMD